jgi:hypothetical protein
MMPADGQLATDAVRDAKFVDANRPRGAKELLPVDVVEPGWASVDSKSDLLAQSPISYCFLRRSATIWSKPFSFIVLLKRSR